MLPWGMHTWWRHVRAALVLIHLLAVVVLAVPSLRAAMDRRSWRNPTVQGELEAFAERLDSVGIHLTPKTLEQKVWRYAVAYNRVYEALEAPFFPYRHWVGVRQPWVMFVAPHRHPARVEIEVEEDHRWRLVYRARSDEHTWHRTLFDHDRLRSALFRYGWDRYRRAYRELCRYIAEEAARDFPKATRVRVRMYRYRTPSPEEVRAGEIPAGRYEREVILPLGGGR